MGITAREQVELADLLGAKAGRLINVLSDLSTIKPPALITEQDIRTIDQAAKSLAAPKQQAMATSAPIAAAAADTMASFMRGLSGMASGLVNGSGIKGKLQALLEIQRIMLAKGIVIRDVRQ